MKTTELPTTFMCPHCGHVPAWLYLFRFIPEHTYLGRKCPGSGQYPRNCETDRRPLWKDEEHDSAGCTINRAQRLNGTN